MSLKAIASHLVKIMHNSPVFDKKYQASILVKMIETAFSILSPECSGLKIQKKGLITHLKLLARNSVKRCTLSSMANGPK